MIVNFWRPVKEAHVVIVGAGIAGIAAAVQLAASGLRVTACEAESRPGGKIRSCDRQDMDIDVGPTVFTMPWVFDDILAPAGRTLAELVALEQLEVLAHHRWPDGSQLDLYADVERSAAAIEVFAGGRAARQYLRFSTRAKSVHDALVGTFMTRPQPGFLGLFRNAGPGGLASLAAVRPFRSLWHGLGGFFDDERLRQLFARYATYYGSSPFAAPATLMLIAHVEQLGVWKIDGGLRALTLALANVAEACGTSLRYDARVARVSSAGGRVSGVELESGETIGADKVIVNADINALASGELGSAARAAAPPTPVAERSLSAMTWAGKAACSAPLGCHNVVFSSDYRKEFNDLSSSRGLPTEPTVYLHAPDRPGANGAEPKPERLFLLVNAAARGDERNRDVQTIDAMRRAVERQLGRCGIDLDTELSAFEATTPADFHRRYPATGGALYGRATHHWTTPFRRAGSRTRIPGLYVAGGSVHPGAGVPMAALSGKLAAAEVLADLA